MPNRHLSRWLTVLGVLSLVLYAVIACLSQSFSYGHGYQDRPILGFVGVYGLVFIVYAVAVWRVKRQATEAVPFTLVLIFAALFRLVILFSEPIQEDDFYRYLWGWQGSCQRSESLPFHSPRGTNGQRKRRAAPTLPGTDRNGCALWPCSCRE